MQEALCAIVGNGYENEVRGLAAGLEAEAGAGELDEGRSTPAMAGAAGDDALTILSAYEEGTLFEAGDNGDASCVHGNAIGNAAIGGGHQLVKNGVGRFDAVIQFGVVGRVGVRTHKGGQQDEGQ
jgi:hypothetical protein